MPGEQSVRVLLEIRHTGKTVSGHVTITNCSPSDFFGWLELIDRLERASDGAGRASLAEPGDERRPAQPQISEELQ
jgi:hypothetical protein